MKKISVDLIESSYAHFFSIDSQDNRENIIKAKTGILKRNFNQQWTSSSHELTSVNEAAGYLEKKTNLKGYDNLINKYPFQPGKIIRENQHLLACLQKMKVSEWKIIFRANHLSKIILKKGLKEKKNNFNHFSVLIRLRLKNNGQWIEVGEGSVREAKFNQDGLISRITEVLDNLSQKFTVQFREKVPVVLEAGDGGILFHEILGHALEADYIFHNQSPFSVKDIGQRVISKNVNLVTNEKSDPFFKGIHCDDEGETTKSVSLIEKGVLKNIISDTFYKYLLDNKNCGHSRNEDFTRLPMPRMYALYLRPGQFHPEELISSTKLGIYAREFGEGKIYFEKDLFYFNIRDARLIENGRATAPLGNITVSGSIREVLNSVDMVANDFRLDKGISYCFKNGQTLNVRVGQPTVKINNLIVTKETND